MYLISTLVNSVQKKYTECRETFQRVAQRMFLGGKKWMKEGMDREKYGKNDGDKEWWKEEGIEIELQPILFW